MSSNRNVSDAPVSLTAPPRPGGKPAAFLLLLAVLAAVSLYSACATTQGGTLTVLVSSAENQTSVVRGKSIQIMASVLHSKNNSNVTWSLSGPNCPANCGSLSSTTANPVIYTAPSSEGADFMVTITATSAQDSSKSGALTLSVTAPPPISLTITTEPPATLAPNGTANVVARVDNDSSNAGVDWALSCGGGDCGTITAHTASGVAATYTAPAAIPPSAVTITAKSTADPTAVSDVFVQISMQSNLNNSKLNGRYAFLLAGWDNSTAFSPAAVAGSFSADGNGGVTAGVIDRSLNAGVHLDEAITGSYDIGNDGRGVMNLVITGSGDAITIRFAVASLGTSRIISFGNSPDTSFQASGVMKLQDTTDFGVTGDFVFGIEGVNLAASSRSAAVGRFTTNSSGSITSGTIDVDVPLSASGALTLSGTISAPGASDGRGTLSLSATSLNPLNLVYYQINSQELLLLDVDVTNRVLFTGTIRRQIRPAGGFKASSFAPTVVFELTGYDGSHSQSNTGVGFVTSDGAGNVTSAFLDQNADATFVSAGTVGTYAFDADGNGRAILNLTGVQPNTLYFYDLNSAFFLQGTPADVGEDVTFGIAEIQTITVTPPPFGGTYAFSTANPVTPFVPNFSGVLTADAESGTFSGTMDITFGQGGSASQHDVPISGTFLPTPAQAGRTTLTLTPQGGTPIHLVLWSLSNGKVVGVISDAVITDSAVMIFQK